MHHTTLIVPGYHGSGESHWQSWLEAQVPEARRVCGIDWESPLLARWSERVREEIDESPNAVWLVAHSFGCLASVVAAADRPEKVAGALLVAPANPQRFTPLGTVTEQPQPAEKTIAPWLPDDYLGFASVVVGSSNDPWVPITIAQDWAERWGSKFVDLGAAGHINTDAGYGPWPFGLDLLHAMQAAHEDLPLGSIGDQASRRGRRGALARIRHQTRSSLHLKQEERP
ncbi:MAG: esterase [Betaproteobacteria bacterium HGW-Betaproteobacteria-13]|nr:MAG: esterase [Betaproteobacteria bacterium HGW-Betaproteobacteria-13]